MEVAGLPEPPPPPAPDPTPPSNTTTTTVAEKKERAEPRRLVKKPPPSAPNKQVGESITAVPCKLRKIITTNFNRRRRFLPELRKVIITINKMRVNVSMLATELCLRKLELGEPLPELNQNFYSALYTSTYKGEWKHGQKHNNLLEKYHVEEPPYATLMHQAMGFVARQMASSLKTHYELHYERFYQRWLKWKETKKSEENTTNSNTTTTSTTTTDTTNNDDFDPDPDKVKKKDRIRMAWKMHCQLEKDHRHAFTLFPEARYGVKYVTLDTKCITVLYKALYPDDPLCFNKKKFKTIGGEKTPCTLSDGDLAYYSGRAIFRKLFHMKRVKKLRGKEHQFRFSLQTDGYGVSLNFVRFFEYGKKEETKQKTEQETEQETQQKMEQDKKQVDHSPNKPANKPAKKKKQPVLLNIKDMILGLIYVAKNKIINSLADLNWITFRAVDPGVHRPFTAVDLLTGRPDEDVRKTAMILRSTTFRKLTKSTHFAKKLKRMHDRELHDVQEQLNTTPFRDSSSSYLYSLYSDNCLHYQDALWEYYTQPKLRNIRFRARAYHRCYLDREVNRLCKPRKGDTHTLLVIGNAVSKNIFGKIKGCTRGPAKQIVDQAARRKAAVIVMVDEYHTSKLDIYGEKLVHPPERCQHKLQPTVCKLRKGASDPCPIGTLGCWCRCRKQGCDKVCTTKCWCEDHRCRITQHDVCYHNNHRYGHRMWNRDVSAAINIGCRFLAEVTGKDLGPWSRRKKEGKDGNKDDDTTTTAAVKTKHATVKTKRRKTAVTTSATATVKTKRQKKDSITSTTTSSIVATVKNRRRSTSATPAAKTKPKRRRSITSNATSTATSTGSIKTKRRKTTKKTVTTISNKNSGTRDTVAPRLVGWASVFESSEPKIPVSRVFRVYRWPKWNKQPNNQSVRNSTPRQ